MANCPKCSSASFMSVPHPNLKANLIACGNAKCGAVVGAIPDGTAMSELENKILDEIRKRVPTIEEQKKLYEAALNR